MQADHRRQRHQRVAQHVAHGHAPWAQALRLCGAHEILALHLEHRRAGEPRIDRHEESCQRERWQQHVAHAVSEPCKAMQLRANRRIAAARQPAQMNRKQHDRQQPDPEPRRRIKQQRQHRQNTVRPTAGPMRHHRAKHDAGHDGERQRNAHQQQRIGQPRQDQLHDRHFVARRVAEAEVRQMAQITPQLMEHGLIEAELRAQHRHGLDGCRARLAGDHVGRVAGHHPQQKEVQDHDAEHRWQCLPRGPTQDRGPARTSAHQLALRSLRRSDRHRPDCPPAPGQ